MTTESEISEGLRQAADDPFAFFGRDGAAVLKEWKIATHPDRWPGREEEAKGWFTRFTELADQAKTARTIGRYRIKRKLADGDLCVVSVATDGSRDVLIKEPVAKAASLMKAEVENLAKVRAFANEQAKHLFPVPVESIGQVNVFEFANDLESVASVMRRYPNGIDGRHVGWMFKRILLALTWAHGAGVIHGAVTPEHVLVCKRNHGIVLCDWIHSGAPGTPIRLVPGKYKGSYPDFAVREKKLCSELDISMAAKLMDDLADRACPRLVRTSVHGLRYHGAIRGESAWTLHEEFDSVLRRTYGAPKWVDFV